MGGKEGTTTLPRRLSRFFSFTPADEIHEPLTPPPSDQESPNDPPTETNRHSLPAPSNMSGKLTKNPGHSARHSSVPTIPPHALPPPSSYVASPQQAHTAFMDPSFGLPPPPPIRTDGFARSGPSSAPNSPIHRPYHSNRSVPDLTKPPSSPTTEKKKKKGWFSGLVKSGHKHHDTLPPAWILGQRNTPYDLQALLNGQPIPELWDERGDTYVYLHPATSNKGPSFRVQSSIFAASKILPALAHGRSYSIGSESAPGSEYRYAHHPHSRNVSLHGPSLATPPLTPEQLPVSRDMYVRPSSFELSPPQEFHLYLPLSLSTNSVIQGSNSANTKHTLEDIETLVASRNLFSFLIGGSLVATEYRASVFSIFMKISNLLTSYEFSNLDASTFGDMAANSFDKYVDELGLADTRASREKTIESLVLGEHMRSVLLYNEAFVHAVGKYDEIIELKSPLFDRVSPVTRTRLERANLDLNGRVNTLETKLENFDFPAIFSGIMNSKTADERKEVNFAAWRESFMMMRKFTLNYYRQHLGAWPPKASSKKNNLETSGLNRLVVRELYYDLVSLYDLLVDRHNLTSRTIGAPIADKEDHSEAETRVCRYILDEYDRSTPPVQPPIPFDVPLLPTLTTTRPDYGRDVRKDHKVTHKKLKREEVDRILIASYNEDANIQTPFLDAFRLAEHKAAHGCNITDIKNLRVGQWLFLYAVIQSLPMLVVDAPQIRFTNGVEYFLCEPPRSGVPWARSESQTLGQMRSYGVPGAANVTVSLPSDVLEFGVEGVYKRSHCWVMAQKWAAQAGLMRPISSTGLSSVSSSQRSAGSPESAKLTPPTRVPVGRKSLLDPSSASSARSGSPGAASQRHSIISLGLEEVPLAVTGSPTLIKPQVRRAPEVDPSKTFDAIIGDMEQVKEKKKKR